MRVPQESDVVFRSWENILFDRHFPEQVDAFYKYFGVWTMFNALYKQDSQIRIAVSKNTTERQRVESFSHCLAFGTAHNNLLKQDPEYRVAVKFIAQRSPNPPTWMGQECHLDTVRIWNMDQKYKDKWEKQGRCNGEADLKGLLGCLYVVRCNLFHGSKVVGNEADIELLGNGYTVLHSLLHLYNFC